MKIDDIQEDNKRQGRAQERDKERGDESYPSLESDISGDDWTS